MIVLDSDHVTVLRYPENEKHATLQHRMETTEGETFAISIVSVEEQMRGWLALIRRFRKASQQVAGYQRLQRMFDFFKDWELLPFDLQAADELEGLRKQRIRIGSQDLKIAAIALTNDALLLSANLRDFQKVPGLRVENWLV
jgi:tRNA(fMet)-specific endonuclease VapC